MLKNDIALLIMKVDKMYRKIRDLLRAMETTSLYWKKEISHNPEYFSDGYDLDIMDAFERIRMGVWKIQDILNHNWRNYDSKRTYRKTKRV